MAAGYSLLVSMAFSGLGLKLDIFHKPLELYDSEENTAVSVTQTELFPGKTNLSPLCPHQSSEYSPLLVVL